MRKAVAKHNVLSLIFRLTVAAFVLVSCSEKKESTDIIIEKPVERAPAEPVVMQSYTLTDSALWQGKTYVVSITRTADMELPMITDDEGDRYHDNRFSVKVTRADGSTFLNRDFVKTDFANYIDGDYLRRSAMLGFVFDEVADDCLCFAASVGSPDELSDEYVPLTVKITRGGNISVRKNTRLDLIESGEEAEGE